MDSFFLLHWFPNLLVCFEHSRSGVVSSVSSHHFCKTPRRTLAIFFSQTPLTLTANFSISLSYHPKISLIPINRASFSSTLAIVSFHSCRWSSFTTTAPCHCLHGFGGGFQDMQIYRGCCGGSQKNERGWWMPLGRN